MYEAVKKYETYVARNKRLEGQSSNPSAGQQKTSGQASNYKLRFHKTTAFAAKVEESEAQVDPRQEAQPTEEGNPSEAESSLDDDDGLYIPSYLEEAAPNDPVLQVRLAHAICKPMRRRPVGAIDVTNRVICKKTARSLRKKTVKGPSRQRGLFQPNRRRRRPS